MTGLEHVRKRLPSLASLHVTGKEEEACGISEHAFLNRQAKLGARAPKATPEDSLIEASSVCCSPDSLTNIDNNNSCSASRDFEACECASLPEEEDELECDVETRLTCTTNEDSCLDKLKKKDSSFCDLAPTRHKPVKTQTLIHHRPLKFPLKLPLFSNVPEAACDTQPLLSPTRSKCDVTTTQRKFSHVDTHALDVFFSPESDDGASRGDGDGESGASASKVFLLPRVGVATPSETSNSADVTSRDHQPTQLRFDSLDSADTDPVTSSLSVCTTVTDSTSSAHCRRHKGPDIVIDDVTAPRIGGLDTSLRLGPVGGSHESVLGVGMGEGREQGDGCTEMCLRINGKPCREFLHHMTSHRSTVAH